MTDDQRAKIRVSDTEREDALGKLGEHMSNGRLDIDEYGERTAKVAAAKTRGDVLALFEDLPEPRPTFGQPVVAAPTAVTPVRQRTVIEKYGAVVIPVIGVLAVIGLVVLTRMPFLLFIAFFFLASNRGHWGGPGGPRGPRRHRGYRYDYRYDYRRDWRRSAD